MGDSVSPRVFASGQWWLATHLTAARFRHGGVLALAVPFPPGRLAIVLGCLCVLGMRYAVELDLWAAPSLIGAGLTLSVMADLGLSRLLEPPALPPATDEASDLLGAAADEPRLTHAASSAPARGGRPGGCPRCADAALVDARCPSCGGELWGAAALEAFARDRLHLDGAEGVRELAASAPTSQLACPSCSTMMKTVRLKGEDVELCLGCGALWADDGETARIERAVRRTSASDGALRRLRAVGHRGAWLSC